MRAWVVCGLGFRGVVYICVVGVDLTYIYTVHIIAGQVT